MNAHRSVLPKVWKGLKYAKHQSLIATPIGQHADRDRENERNDLNTDESLQIVQSGEKRWTTTADFGQGRVTGLKKKGSPFDHLREIGIQFGRSSSYGVDQICAVLDGRETRRLDVFPVAVNIHKLVSSQSVLSSSKPKEKKPVTADICVQTDVSGAEKTMVDEVSAMIDKFSADIQNEVGRELAEEKLGTEALQEWRNAAARGSPDAMYNLAICYSLGQFVSKNIHKAFELWKKASLHGHALSTYQLAVCHIRGLGTSVDEKSGMELMEKSAKSECPDAQFYIAIKLLDQGETSQSEVYLRDAVRKESIREEVTKWMKMDSIPSVVKNIIERILTEQPDI